MIPKLLNVVKNEDLQSLVDNGMREGRTIEYKQLLPGHSDSDKREFLADVSSFANAVGGDLIYGIVAKDGLPESISGLIDFNEDKERLRLESTIRDGIDPRIPGIQLKAVPGFSSGPTLVLRVPRSWTAPHMVTFKGSSRFYSRSSAGKFRMDVMELRSAFEAAGDLPERIRRWRDERLGRIVAGEGPMLLSSPACLAIHLIPLESMINSRRLDIADVEAKLINVPLLGGGGYRRFNIDGLLTFSVSQANNQLAQAYTQLFRSGCIEAVNAHLLDERDGHRLLASQWFEPEILRVVKACLKNLEALGIELPIVFFLTIVGAKGAWMTVDSPDYSQPIDRDLLLTPDVLIEEYTCDLPRVLRPAFDAVWNACGFPNSLNYSENGIYSLRW